MVIVGTRDGKTVDDSHYYATALPASAIAGRAFACGRRCCSTYAATTSPGQAWSVILAPAVLR